MNKKILTGGISLTLILLTAGLVAWYLSTGQVDENVENDVDKEEFTLLTYETILAQEGDFKLDVGYDSTENNWQYRVRGSLPGSCYSINPNIEIGESEPEIVYITADILQEGEQCLEVTTLYGESIGTFDAASEAEILFRVGGDIWELDPTPADSEVIFDLEEFDTIVSDKQDIQFDYGFDGENWRYRVTGFLPNSCYNGRIETTILESFPEIVKVTYLISEIQDPDILCTQALVDIEDTGIIQVSPEAEFDFSVNQ